MVYQFIFSYRSKETKLKKISWRKDFEVFSFLSCVYKKETCHELVLTTLAEIVFKGLT